MFDERARDAKDLGLLRAWRAGDRRAASALYERCLPAVRGVLRRKAPDCWADLVQDTFLALLRQPRFEPESVTRYLVASAHNIFNRHLGRKYKRRREAADFVDACVAVHNVRDPAAALEGRELELQLGEALGRISVDDREVLRLRYFAGLSVEAAANAIGLPGSTMPGRLLRAKQRLRRAFARTGEPGGPVRGRPAAVTRCGA